MDGSRFLVRQVDRDVLPLRVALEHPFERKLTADATFFIATVGVTRTLAQTLVDLDPTGLDRVCSAEGPANVVRPDVGCEPVVTVVGHTDRVVLVAPRDGNKHRAEDLLAGQAPVVRHIREDGGDCVIAFAERPVLGRKAADNHTRLTPFQSFFDIATHLRELLLVNDGADVARLIERIAELEYFYLLAERIEKIVEDVAVEEEARARRARLALPREAHRGNDAIDDPVLIRIGKDDRGALTAEFERDRHDAVGGRAHNELAHLRRAGEREFAHHWMVGERGTAFLTEPGQHIEHAGW